MKSLRRAIPIIIMGSALIGCANPIVVKIDEGSKRITGLAEVAKSQLEDCRSGHDKSACDDVDSSLNEIIITSNGLPDVVKELKSPFQK